ncbi:hypothetical protein [Acrocarpospora catenulata]|uniref:hypothetical protein n=1 Tax=Acrocarpospora catenulata TaxID=2836182 RepID=UPI001BDB4E98|nr:hypothetical protein [Acrocarpospora catenulata]
MADHELIERELDVLAGRLPASIVDELADGLTETYQAQLARLGEPDAAAKATLAEFGDADTISAAFVRAAPGRAAALVLLAIGPLVGALWATALVTAQAWTWPVPIAARLTVGATLALLVTVLALTIRAKRHYKAVQIGAIGAACGFVMLDLTVLITAKVLATPSLLIACALAASLTRITITAQLLIRFR